MLSRDPVATARATLGEPDSLILLRQDGALRVDGWVLGRGRAECQTDGQLSHIVGVDVVLVADGRYAVCERSATDSTHGVSHLEAVCNFFETAAEARARCQEQTEDTTRDAARVAALDHATKRWSLFRGSRQRRSLELPFRLD